MISLWCVYFFILVCYNGKFGISILYEQPKDHPDYNKVVSATQLQNTASSTKIL